ncbi:MAG: metal ABC transporter permease [Oscillospiraceae bacterium]|jgi:zinc transport system permease protein|nr:metal ABC transporter permease [Oscillospiraceae bacterium]
MFFSFLFAWLEYEFMQNALLAILLISPILGLTGTMIVQNKMAFFSDALGHCALTGAALGTILGISNPEISVLAFSIAFAIGISAVIESDISSSDTVVGVFSSVGLALGIVMLSLIGGFEKFSIFFVGDILSVSRKEITTIAFLLIATVTVWVLFFNKIMLSSISKDLAISKQVNSGFCKNVFLILIAMIVAISIKLIGILIINSLLTLPAAAARNVSCGIKNYHILTIIFSMISGFIGLILSFYIGVSAGAMIVIVSALIFTITFFCNVFKNS